MKRIFSMVIRIILGICILVSCQSDNEVNESNFIDLGQDE